MELREWLANSSAAPPTRPIAPSTGYPQGGVTPTKPGAYWYHQITEELRALITAAGVALDATVLTQLRQAIKRLTGGNATAVTFAASPFALTADAAGLVLIDAVAGNVVINLPLADTLAALKYEFRRLDTSANTVTINRTGADVIDNGAAFITLANNGVQKLVSDGGSGWNSVTPVAASQAEVNAGADDAKFVTSKKLRWGFSISLTSIGYIAFPTWMGGLIIQWGSFSMAAATDATIPLPIAFPNAFYQIAACGDYSPGSHSQAYYNATPNGSKSSFVACASAGIGMRWVAIGY